MFNITRYRSSKEPSPTESLTAPHPELTKLWIISTCGQPNFGDKFLQYVYSSTLGFFNHPFSTQQICLYLFVPTSGVGGAERGGGGGGGSWRPKSRKSRNHSAGKQFRTSQTSTMIYKTNMRFMYDT